MSAGHLPRGMYRGPAGPRWTSQRELQGPSSRQHPSTCPARPAGFQNTQCLPAWLPQEGQLGASTCSVLGLHPCCLRSQRTTSSSPSLSPKPSSLQDRALGLHRLQAHWPHTCLSLPLPGTTCITSRVAGGLGLRDRTLHKQPSGRAPPQGRRAASSGSRSHG